MSIDKKITPQSYHTSYLPTWCPGCGDFGIMAAIKNALSELQIPSHNVVIVYGIGCAGNMASTIKCYGFHSLHGRALPVALGAKIANKNLTVIAVAGDGDQYSEGTNHLIHLARYNSNITLIVANNRLFSLTTGQASPTTPEGTATKTTPWGEIKHEFNPLALSLVSGTTFVARGAAFNLSHLTNLIKQGIKHPGFSHIDVLQQCVTLNKINTVEWYQQRVYELGANYDKNNYQLALDKALETEKLPIGIFYQTKRPVYEEKIDWTAGTNAITEKIVFNKEKLLKEFE
ncbi:MAG TPA: thiamine pyrophosphate-dependent enzyme [bacterium]|nr:thiamine pyrophosphate-dependent enzyme [bacterium]HPL95473.1 thiamine pyrophosphate-dependent enzyme [bacterium]